MCRPMIPTDLTMRWRFANCQYKQQGERGPSNTHKAFSPNLAFSMPSPPPHAHDVVEDIIHREYEED